MKRKIIWPQNKKFAFTIFDDTDLARLNNISPVYDYLTDLGIRTTKSVWPLSGKFNAELQGDTLENEDYLKFILNLKQKGFEIAFHNATYHSSARQEILQGLEKFKEKIGEYPKSFANHNGCQEGIYWGKNRLTGNLRNVYNLFMLRGKKNFEGHIPNSNFFWGDFCCQKIKYVRNFVFGEINTLKVCPFMPYHDTSKPFVRYWFSSSEGRDISIFNQCISESRQDQLEVEGGACIIYTHFAKGFMEQGGLNSRFKILLKRLSAKKGWFVPVSEVLDYLLQVHGHHEITDRERKRLELKWFLHKLIIGGTC